MLSSSFCLSALGFPSSPSSSPPANTSAPASSTCGAYRPSFRWKTRLFISPSTPSLLDKDNGVLMTGMTMRVMTMTKELIIHGRNQGRRVADLQAVLHAPSFCLHNPPCSFPPPHNPRPPPPLPYLHAASFKGGLPTYLHASNLRSLLLCRLFIEATILSFYPNCPSTFPH